MYSRDRLDEAIARVAQGAAHYRAAVERCDPDHVQLLRYLESVLKVHVETMAVLIRSRELMDRVQRRLDASPLTGTSQR